jgi:hypothetical protein
VVTDKFFPSCTTLPHPMPGLRAGEEYDIDDFDSKDFKVTLSTRDPWLVPGLLNGDFGLIESFGERGAAADLSDATEGDDL